MPGFADALGKTGEAAWQLFVWQIMGEVVSALLTPYLTELTYLVNEAHPDVVLPVNDLVSGVVTGHITQADAKADAAKLGIDGARFDHLLEIARPKLSPADLAQLIVRGFMDRGTAVTEAGFTGLDAHRLDLLTKIAADAPGPGDLATALRRGLIPEDAADPEVPSFAGGIRQGRLSNIWIPMYRELSKQWPSPVDALQAELEGQLTHEEALAEYKRLGGDEQFYAWLFNTRGTAPSPVELGILLNRGIIPYGGTGPDATSFVQGILEGPSRNKWTPAWLALKDYVIPPRSVVAMVHAGTVTDDIAARLLAMSGANAETVAAFIAEGHARASAADKNLTVSTVIGLYESRIIAQTDAHNLLTALGYSDQNATYLTTLADLRREIAALNSAISRVHNLYVARKINRSTVLQTLTSLGVPADQRDEIVRIWDLEVAVTVKQLTPAQIVTAAKKGVVTGAEALDELVALGYTPFDGWVLLATALGPDAPAAPDRNPAPLGVIP